MDHLWVMPVACVRGARLSEPDLSAIEQAVGREKMAILADAACLRRSLTSYARDAWQWIEPSSPCVWGWHLDAICEHLEAVSTGQIRNLLINMPPRHTKPVDVNALVLMGNGERKRLGDVAAGDMVLTHANRRARVAEVHEQGELDQFLITTFGGRQVRTAPDHPFLTPEGWVQAKDLRVGQSLAVLLDADTSPDAPNTDQEFELAGYFVGDGCVAPCGGPTSCFATITSADADYGSDLRRLASDMGFGLLERKRKGKNVPEITVFNFSGGVRTWLREIGLARKTSYTKRVPEFVFRGSNRQVAKFLAAYFHCDGMVGKKDAKRRGLLVSFSSVSGELLSDVQHLLARLGIAARLRRRTTANDSKFTRKGYVYYVLDITREDDAARFLERVPVHGRKRARLLEHAPLMSFDETYISDRVVSIEDGGRGLCRCLTIDGEDSSFTANDLVVHNSLSVSVFWPTWTWTHSPTIKWLYSSYAQALSTRDALSSRRLIASKWYQERWGPVYKLTSDQNTKTRYDNDKSGYRIATSVDGSATGEGGDIIVVDDPHNVNESESALVRESVLVWWDQTMSTRFNDPKTGRRVIVMQRVHEADLSGHVLEQGGYEHLCLPAEYEPNRRNFTILGKYERRTKAGELLHPERFGPAEIVDLKKRLGTYATAGQLQQRPAPAEGGVIKRAWWKFYREPPMLFDKVLYSWDATFKDADTSDYVVGQVWGLKDVEVYLLDQVRDRMDFTATLQAVVSLRAKWAEKRNLLSDESVTQLTLIEDAANGPAIIATLRNKIPALIPVKVGQAGKEARLQAVAPLIEAGNVFLPSEAPFTMDLIEEAAAFPKGEHDDQLDALSQALARLQSGVWNPAEKVEPPPQTYEELHALRMREVIDKRIKGDEDGEMPARFRLLRG